MPAKGIENGSPGRTASPVEVQPTRRGPNIAIGQGLQAAMKHRR
jgi:hypothetical protein